METGCDETDSANHGEPLVQAVPAIQAVHAPYTIQNDHIGVQSNDRTVLESSAHEDLAKPLLEKVDSRENDDVKNKVIFFVFFW